MPIFGRKERQLDGEEIMELWVQMGVLDRVYKFFETQGRVNPDTGQPFTKNSLWRACQIYLINNPEKSRELYKKAGSIFTDEEWELYVLRRAMQVHKTSRSTFLRWVITKKWPRKYEHLFREAYGVRGESDYDYFEQTMRRMPGPDGSVIQTAPKGRPKRIHSTDIPE